MAIWGIPRILFIVGFDILDFASAFYDVSIKIRY